MKTSSTYQAYLDRYSPEAYMQFYASLEKEFSLYANPARVIPISHAPLILDQRFQEAFSSLISLFWPVLDNKSFQSLSAENIPAVLRQPGGAAPPQIPFALEENIGCIDLHLDGDALQMIEYMVLPPGIVGIYPGLLARYGAYLKTLLDDYRPICFQAGWDRQRCEAVMMDHVLGGAAPERVAIIDWEPESQVTYGEFRYFLNLLKEQKGLPGLIADPRDVSVDGSRIKVKGEGVDLILNRLTLPDLLLHHNVCKAYSRLLGEAPEAFVYHPYLWYLGDKASLTLLSDPSVLEQIGLPAADRSRLRSLIPPTRRLSAFYRPATGSVDISRLMEFFGGPSRIVLKPISSHASKGIIFGPTETPSQKELQEVLQQIDPQDYVAMQYVPTPGITVPRGGGRQEQWKCDIRIFVLNGQYVFPGGRVYYGDYTNQVPCRGFAPLFFE